MFIFECKKLRDISKTDFAFNCTVFIRVISPDKIFYFSIIQVQFFIVFGEKQNDLVTRNAFLH